MDCRNCHSTASSSRSRSDSISTPVDPGGQHDPARQRSPTRPDRRRLVLTVFPSPPLLGFRTSRRAPRLYTTSTCANAPESIRPFRPVPAGGTGEKSLSVRAIADGSDPPPSLPVRSPARMRVPGLGSPTRRGPRERRRGGPLGPELAVGSSKRSRPPRAPWKRCRKPD